MSVTKIERYRAVCDDCGAMGDLRDSEALAVKHAIDRQNCAIVVENGTEKLLCLVCQAARATAETMDAQAKAILATSALRAMAAKSAAFDAVRVEADGEVKGEAPWLPRMLDEALAKERARRGMP